MNRRAFLKSVGVAAVAGPLALAAKPETSPVKLFPFRERLMACNSSKPQIVCWSRQCDPADWMDRESGPILLFAHPDQIAALKAHPDWEPLVENPVSIDSTEKTLF